MPSSRHQQRRPRTAPLGSTPNNRIANFVRIARFASDFLNTGMRLVREVR